MRSLYRRQLTMMVSIMLVSFTLLAGAFMLLSYRYIIGETRDLAERNAGYVSSFTSSYYLQNRTIQSHFYSGYVASLARISNSHIIIANPDGGILYATDGWNFYTYENNYLPPDLVGDVMANGSYNGMTNLGGILPERRYMAAMPIVADV